MSHNTLLGGTAGQECLSFSQAMRMQANARVLLADEPVFRFQSRAGCSAVAVQLQEFDSTDVQPGAFTQRSQLDRPSPCRSGSQTVQTARRRAQ